MANELNNLQWVEENLPRMHQRKRMFGGFGYYLDEKLILVVFETYGNKAYRGQKFDFEIWNGCMFPVEKDLHHEVLQNFPFLINHPVLPKWLYLPAESEDFENNADLILKELRRRNTWFGTFPKQKKPKIKKSIGRINMRVPQMFREESATEILIKAKKISDLKNFGPETENSFIKAGIKTAPEFIRMGWKKALEKLYNKNPKYAHAIFAYTMIGALKNQMWNLISDEDKREAQTFTKELRMRSKKNKSLPKKIIKRSKKQKKKNA